MPTYRRKPPTVQAEQWAVGRIIPGVSERNGKPLVSTRGGTIEGQPGDWIVDEGNDVRYPVNPVTFAATFEVVPGG